MKYCIVMPKQTELNSQVYFFPIGIAYVSASLKHTGRDVLSYNLNYKDGTIREQIQSLVMENQVDVLATGGLTGQYTQIREILDAARAVKPDIILWVGGGIITSAPVPAMEALEIADYGMIGEGEITICELADAMEGKRDIHSVDGLVFRESGSWTITAPRAEIMDLDSLPYPDYEGFEFAELLKKMPTDQLATDEDHFGFLSFGRSCPFQCTFCFHPSGRKYRRRSMESIFREIDYLVEKYDIRNIYITDELFVSRAEDLNEFCAGIKKRGIGFSISLRVDMVNREMLTMLRDHGCITILFGLESADNRILKSMKKGITVEQIDNALSMCAELGIRTHGSFIFGDEAETVETAENTIRWWSEHSQYSITGALIILYPGSELYKNACKRGVIQDEAQFIRDGCPYINVSRMTDAEYRNMALKIGMLPDGRTDVLKGGTAKFSRLGKVDYTASCPKCGKVNTWVSLDPFRNKINIVCRHCGYSMHVVVADSIGHEAEANLKRLKQHKIAFWPMVNTVEELRRIAPSMLESNVYFIDSAKVKQGARYYNKTVHAPDIINEAKIDTIFLTLTTYWATEIMESIQKYPSVRQVFFAGDLLDPEFPSRIIESGRDEWS